MEKNHTMPILASYVTYKELSSRGNYKSPYQILAEFIKYIIYEKKLYAFSIGEIKSRVENEFEFYFVKKFGIIFVILLVMIVSTGTFL